MPVYTTNFSKLLLPGIREIYGLEYAQYPEEYSKVYAVDTSTMAYDEDQGITGLGLVPTKPEGRGITYDQAFQGYTKRYTHVAYGLGIIITREAYEDDQYRKMRLLPKALARSVRQSIETLGAATFNNAFTASAAYYGGDSKEMCATDHPLIGGGTFSNELDTAADLDISSFEQALLDISEFVDDRGLKVAARPKLLIIPPSLDFQAQYILKSDKLPDSAENNYNPAKGLLPYTIMHWLTDTDAWFIQTDVPLGLTWLWRRRPEFGEDTDFDSENAKYKTTFRCQCGWTDPRGIFGSPGG